MAARADLPDLLVDADAARHSRPVWRDPRRIALAGWIGAFPLRRVWTRNAALALGQITPPFRWATGLLRLG
jgi:hypothetical protein